MTNGTPQMTPEAKAQLDMFNEKQVDWFGKCMICQETVRGSLADLKAHARECGRE